MKKICTVTLIMCIYFGQTANGQNKSKINTSIPEGKARIEFTRKSSLFSAILSFQIVDRGTGIDYNSILLHVDSTAESKPNFESIYNMEAYFIDEDTVKGQEPKSNGHPGNYNSSAVLEALKEEKNIREGSIADMFFNDARFRICHNGNYVYLEDTEFDKIKKMKKNAAIVVEKIGNGQTVAWDRNPGIMRLVVMYYGGGEAIAPAFQIEAGKTYRVSYNYMKAFFEISEKKVH